MIPIDRFKPRKGDNEQTVQEIARYLRDLDDFLQGNPLIDKLLKNIMTEQSFAEQHSHDDTTSVPVDHGNLASRGTASHTTIDSYLDMISETPPTVGATQKIPLTQSGSQYLNPRFISNLQIANKTADFSCGGVFPASWVHVFRVNTSAGNVTASLPQMSSVEDGTFFFFVKTTAANSLIIDPYGSEQIIGAATYTLTSQYQAVMVMKFGTDQWYIMAGFNDGT